MPDTELLSLRRKRRRICANLAKLEPLLADYHAKFASVEADILRLDPQLWLPLRRYKPNPVFARQGCPGSRWRSCGKRGSRWPRRISRGSRWWRKG
jgi:hypothetical protein